jgi:hypothetical protein
MMSYLAILVISFLATLSLASPVARQMGLCPWNGTPNASNFTLVSVSKVDNSDQKSLALGLNGLSDSSMAWLEVFPLFLPYRVYARADGLYLERRLPSPST